MRRVFKTKTFARWSRKARLPDSALCDAVEEMTNGLIDAELGGHVYKKRVPLPGRGKRGSVRTIVGTKLGDRWFFMFGFEKADRSTIDARELAVLQKVAAAFLAMDARLLSHAMVEGEITEICNEEITPAH